MSESTNAEERGLTGADGVYRFDRVATGKYRLEIQATGFFTKTLEHVALPVSVEMQVRLDVGIMGEAVATKIETVGSPIATQLEPPKPSASQKRAKKPRPAQQLPSTPSPQPTLQSTPAPTKDSATH